MRLCESLMVCSAAREHNAAHKLNTAQCTKRRYVVQHMNSELHSAAHKHYARRRSTRTRCYMAQRMNSTLRRAVHKHAAIWRSTRTRRLVHSAAHELDAMQVSAQIRRYMAQHSNLALRPRILEILCFAPPHQIFTTSDCFVEFLINHLQRSRIEIAMLYQHCQIVALRKSEMQTETSTKRLTRGRVHVDNVLFVSHSLGVHRWATTTASLSPLRVEVLFF